MKKRTKKYICRVGNRARGLKLKAFREENRITLRELEEASGYKNTYWSMLENNQRDWSDRLEDIYNQSIARARVVRDQKVVDRLEAA
jgi:transcriptional regulator with XRE-family HTH domain